MTGLNHGLTGAVIAVAVKKPELALPLAFLSHFVQDVIPHFGVPDSQLFKRKFNIVLVADFVLSVSAMVVLAFLFPAHKWLIWGCMIAAACPDLAWAYYRLYLEKIKNQKPKYDPFTRIHFVLEWSNETWGALVEAGWFVGMWAIILALR